MGNEYFLLDGYQLFQGKCKNGHFLPKKKKLKGPSVVSH